MEEKIEHCFSERLKKENVAKCATENVCSSVNRTGSEGLLTLFSVSFIRETKLIESTIYLFIFFSNPLLR